MTFCTRCRFGYGELPVEQIPIALRHGAREIRARLGAALNEPAGLERLRARPAPTTWSALEYGGHVRDVVLVQHDRLYRVLVEELMTFAPMHRTERVELGGCNDEDPATTATEITIAVDLLARVLGRLDSAQWSRRGISPDLQPTDVDVRWLADDSLHELVHHLLDITEAFNETR